jgi:hypothetical protein
MTILSRLVVFGVALANRPLALARLMIRLHRRLPRLFRILLSAFDIFFRRDAHCAKSQKAPLLR